MYIPYYKKIENLHREIVPYFLFAISINIPYYKKIENLHRETAQDFYLLSLHRLVRRFLPQELKYTD